MTYIYLFTDFFLRVGLLTLNFGLCRRALLLALTLVLEARLLLALVLLLLLALAFLLSFRIELSPSSSFSFLSSDFLLFERTLTGGEVKTCVSSPFNDLLLFERAVMGVEVNDIELELF